MKNRTRQAKLCRFIEQGDILIEATYAPAERALVFKTIEGGILPITLKIRDVWKLARPEWMTAMDRAEKNATEHEENPGQLKIEAVMAAQMPDTILPATGHEVLQVPNVQSVQGPEVGVAEPAKVFVQEPEEPGEAEGAQFQPDVPAVSKFRPDDWL